MACEYKTNPMKGRNELLIKSMADSMNKYGAEGNYLLAAMYRDMMWDCETFFGEFPEDAKISKPRQYYKLSQISQTF